MAEMGMDLERQCARKVGQWEGEQPEDKTTKQDGTENMAKGFGPTL